MQQLYRGAAALVALAQAREDRERIYPHLDERTGSYGVPSLVGARLGSMPRPIGHSTMLPGATPTIRDTILYVSSIVLLHRA